MSYTHLHHLKIKGRVEADKFITKDGTSNDFVKGDGSLDNTEYAKKSYVDDEFAKKSTTVKGVGALEGGGDLTEDREIDLTQETKDDIAKGVTAHGWGNHASAGYATEEFVGDAIDDIEIGGRNLLLGTPSDWTESGGAKIVKDDSADIYRITNPSNGTWGNVRQGTFSVEPEESMTFRMYVVDYEGHIRIQFRRVGGSGPASYKNSTITKTGYVSQTYTNNTSETIKFDLWITVYGDTSGNNGQQFIEMRHYKLEKGNKATDWTPAPEDQVTDWNETNPDSYSFIKNKPKIPSITGLVPYTGANQPIDLNTQDFTTGGYTNRLHSYFERINLASDSTSAYLNFKLLTNVAAAEIGNASSQTSDIIITLPITTSTQWQAEIDILRQGYRTTLNIGGYSVNNTSRFVNGVHGDISDIIEVKFGRIGQSTVLIIKRSDPTIHRLQVNISKFYYHHTNSFDLYNDKTKYKVEYIDESELVGFTLNGVVKNSEFTRDSYLWNKGDFTQTNVDNWNTAFGWGDFRDYGLGVNDSEVTNDSHNDLRTGFYTSNTGTQNLPAGVTGNAFILAMKPREDRAHRLIAAMGRDRIFWQRDFNGWQDPVEFWHSGNLTNVSQLNNDAGYITSVPDRFVTKNNISSSSLTTSVIDFDDAGNGASILYAGANSTNKPSVTGTAGGLLMRGNHSTVGEYQLYLARGENDALLYRNQSGVWNRAASREWVNSQNFSTQTLSNSTSNKIVSSTVQRAALTGDVTAAQNSNATTIANKAVTLAKMADLAANSLIGRGSGTGVPQRLTLGDNLSITGTEINAVDTTYNAGTLAQLNAGTNTTNRVWGAKTIADYVKQYTGDNLGLQGVTDIGNWTTNNIEVRLLNTSSANDLILMPAGSSSNPAGNAPLISTGDKGFRISALRSPYLGTMADAIETRMGMYYPDISNTGRSAVAFSLGDGVSWGYSYMYNTDGSIGNGTKAMTIELDYTEHHTERWNLNPNSQELQFPPESGTLATREWVMGSGDDPTTTIPPTLQPSLGLIFQDTYRNFSFGDNIDIDRPNRLIHAIDTKYTAGSNVSISSSNVISATNTTYSAGSLAQLIAGTQTANRVWSAKNLSDYVESKTEPNQVVITSSLTTNAGHNGSTIVFNGNSAALTVNGTMGAGAELYLINNTGGNRTISSSMISFSLRENGTSTTKSSLQLKPFGVATLVRLSSGTMFMCYGDLI